MISLCIIVKDDSELENLQRAVNSCVKYVNEVNITVTNSKCRKIKEYCNENGYSYSYFAWNNNFADARNFNYSKAKYNQFFIDSDDVVIGAENLPELSKMIDEQIDWISLEYLYAKDELGRVTARHWKPRITRKDTGKWEKSVHECYNPTVSIQGHKSNLVVIDHLQEAKHSEASAMRNLSILLEEYKKDGDKTDARTLFYLAQTIFTLGNFEEAAKYYLMYIKSSGWDEEKYMAYHYMSICLTEMGNIDGAIDSSLQAIKLFPNWSLAYFDLSRAYTLKEDYNRCIEWTLVGFTKDKPNTMNLINDLDYTVMPMGRLADAYLMTGKYEMALDIADKLIKENPKDPLCKELLKTCREVIVKEHFVKSFTYAADMIRREDRAKSIKLFDCIPNSLDGDKRIQNMRFKIVPPKNWHDKSIVIYCGKGNGENWAYPSIYTGIGGSEKMVIQMSRELTKLGYKVTVFNNCGELAGNYEGVEYKPFFHFNPADNYNVLIGWRIPMLFATDIHAKKKLLWLHDIAYPNQFNKKIIDQVDKIIFLSKWHRNNVPEIPENKVFISNNGIVPEEIVLSAKKPNSLLWTASYDRGLICLIKDIMPLIHKENPNVTLDVAYGFNNIDRDMKIIPSLKELKDELVELFKLPYITHHGRVSHDEVAKLYSECEVYAYSSEFGETNCISSQMAQVSSCYVISTPQAGAVPEYLVFGELVDGKGIYTDKKQQQKYAKRVLEYLKNPKTAPEGIKEAFSVKETADSWQKGLLQ